MEDEDELVLVEGLVFENGQWVENNRWCPRSELDAFGRSEEMAHATFRGIVRRKMRRRFYRIAGGLFLAGLGTALVVKTIKRPWYI